MLNDETGIIKTGLFGGAFDPVHNGHLTIAESYLESGLIDELWVMPTPNPPFKQERTSADFVHRYAMTVLAFTGIPKTNVSDFETKLDGVSYTLNTLRALREQFPDRSWSLCIGEDNLSTFHKWYEYEKVLSMADLIVAERPGNIDNGQLGEYKDKIHRIDHIPVDISSTDIRKELSVKGFSSQIPSNVMDYIRANHLYDVRS